MILTLRGKIVPRHVYTIYPTHAWWSKSAPKDDCGVLSPIPKNKALWLKVPYVVGEKHFGTWYLRLYNLAFPILWGIAPLRAQHLPVLCQPLEVHRAPESSQAWRPLQACWWSCTVKYWATQLPQLQWADDGWWWLMCMVSFLKTCAVHALVRGKRHDSTILCKSSLGLCSKCSRRRTHKAQLSPWPHPDNDLSASGCDNWQHCILCCDILWHDFIIFHHIFILCFQCRLVGVYDNATFIALTKLRPPTKSQPVPHTAEKNEFTWTGHTQKKRKQERKKKAISSTGTWVGRFWSDQTCSVYIFCYCCRFCVLGSSSTRVCMRKRGKKKHPWH